MEPGTKRDGRLIAAGTVLGVLFALGTLLPRLPDFDLAFGVEGYGLLGPATFVVAAVLLFVLLAVPGAADRLGSTISGWASRVPAPAAGPTVAVLLGAACWFLPNRTLSGDAGSILYSAAIHRVHPSNALTCYLFRAVEAITGLEPVLCIRLTSTLAGVVYAFTAIAIGRECAPPGPRRAGIAGVLLATGTVGIFFGTIEVYAPLVAAIAVYLYFGIRWIHGKGRGIAPPLCLGVAFGLHGSAGLLLPSLGLLANRGRFWPIPIRRWIGWGALFLVPVLFTGAILYFGTWGGQPPRPGPDRYGTFFGAEGQGPVLPLLLSPTAPDQRYAVLDSEHAVGILNLLLRLAPTGLLLLLLARRPRRDMRIRFAAAVAVFLFLFPNVWNVSYSLRRDWDLFSSLGVPLALMGALAWFSTERSRAGVVRVVALGLFATLPFVLSNSLVREQSIAFARDMATQLEDAVPPVAADAVGNAVEEKAARRNLVPPGEPDAFYRELRIIVFYTLAEVRAFQPIMVSVDPGPLRRDLEQEIVASAGPRLSLPEAGQLAGILTTEVVVVIDRLHENRWDVPAPGILSFLTMRRSRNRRDLPHAWKASPDEDLLLLDVLDRALEAGRGLRRKSPPLDYGSLIEGLSGRLGVYAGDHHVALDVEKWAEPTALAIKELLDPAPDRIPEPRWAQLLAASRAWTRRKVELDQPGRQAALDRAEWISTYPELSTGDRLALAERYARHALTLYPGDPGLTYALARVLYLEGRRDEALPVFRSAVAMVPTALGPRLDLAIALRELGKSEEALRVLARGIRVDPWGKRVLEATVLLAELRRETGRPGIARTLAEEALRRLRTAPPSQENQALEEQLRGLLEEAR